MANVFTTLGKNFMLDALAGEITHISLHDDDPGTNGANELTGGSPAYARKAPTYDSASNGEVDITTGLAFDVPASSEVAWVGFWADTDFVAKAALSTSEVFGAQGTFTLTSAKLKVSDPA